MIVSENTQNEFVFTTRIEFSSSQGDEYIIMREFNTQELAQITAAGRYKSNGEIENTSAFMEQAEKIFPQCVVESSFAKENGSKLSGRELYDVIKKSSSLFTEILHVWLSSNNNEKTSRVKKDGGNPLA